MRPCLLRPRAVKSAISGPIARRRPRRRLYSQAVSPPAEIYDVVCVGGGPAGLSLLNALKSSPQTSSLRIALIESQSLLENVRRHQQATPTEYSNRCSSLTPASIQLLKDVGAWQHIDQSRIQPYHQMKVWDGVSGSRITFDWDSTAGIAVPGYTGAEDTIACMAENNNITTALISRAKELGGIDMLEKVRVENIELGVDDGEVDMRSWPIVQLSDGKKLAARLLVGADGPNSMVRTFAGIESRGWDYERHGVVATVQLESGDYMDDRPSTAYQRFLPTGPAALLPLPGGYATLVWSTLPSRAGVLKRLSTEDMGAMVDAAFRLSPVDLEFMHTMAQGQADEVSWREEHTQFDRSLVPPKVVGVQEGSVASFPLRMRHADTYTGERVALVGDAAHTIHPLAGQGLNQGQADVRVLHGVIEEAVAAGADIGSTLSLEAYNTRRYAANHLMLGVVDKLHKLYSYESGPLVALRSLGLTAVDNLGPLKGFFMSQAAGR